MALAGKEPASGIVREGWGDSRPLQQNEPRGVVLMILHSTFFHAVVSFAGAEIVLLGICVWLRFGLEVYAEWTGIILALIFGFVAIERVLILFSRNARALATARQMLGLAFAELEGLLQKDLDGNGAIGSVAVSGVTQVVNVAPELPERVIELVPTNHTAPRNVFAVGKVNISHADFIEFVRRADLFKGDGLTRENWVGDGKTKSRYKFASGTECNREFYDAIINILMHRLRVVEGSERSGAHRRLTATADEIFNLAKVEV